MAGWRREKGSWFSSLHFMTKGKNLRWPQLEFRMRTSSWGSDIRVLWSWSRAWALPPAQNRYKSYRQASLGKHAFSALGETPWPGWNGVMRERKLGPGPETEWYLGTVKLCRIPCGCCWVSRKYSRCYHYSGYTQLTQKYLGLEGILLVCLWQSAGSYLLYSWFKLKLLSIMGQLFFSSHPPP